MTMTIQELVEKSRSRGARWHEAQEPWDKRDWALAQTGETGELLGSVLRLFSLLMKLGESAGEINNAMKKMRRVETGAPNINTAGRDIVHLEALRAKVAQEVADSILYMPQLCDSLGIDFEEAIRYTFNQKSVEYGFPERL